MRGAACCRRLPTPRNFAQPRHSEEVMKLPTADNLQRYKQIARFLQEKGYPCTVVHRDVERE